MNNIVWKSYKTSNPIYTIFIIIIYYKKNTLYLLLIQFYTVLYNIGSIIEMSNNIKPNTIVGKAPNSNWHSK